MLQFAGLLEIIWSFLEESDHLKIFNFIGSLCKSKTVEFSQAEIHFGHSLNIKFEMVAYNRRDKHIPFVQISQDTKSSLLSKPFNSYEWPRQISLARSLHWLTKAKTHTRHVLWPLIFFFAECQNYTFCVCIGHLPLSCKENYNEGIISWSTTI